MKNVIRIRITSKTAMAFLMLPLELTVLSSYEFAAQRLIGFDKKPCCSGIMSHLISADDSYQFSVQIYI